MVLIELNSIGSVLAKHPLRFGIDLRLSHEGTDEVKETNIRTLTRKYENFKMISGEKIDTFFARFTDL